MRHNRGGRVPASLLALGGSCWLTGCGSDVLPAAPEERAQANAGADEPAPIEAVEAELAVSLGARHAAWIADRSRRARRLEQGLDHGRDRARQSVDPHGPGRALERATGGVAVTLPEVADRAFSLREQSSGLGIGVSLVGARPVARQPIDGFAVYARGADVDATLVLRAGELGVEDFIAFAEPPEEPAVQYRVELDDAVAGLRWVEHTLEFVDASGAPRLRVARPYLVGADGMVTNAELAVVGCAVDARPAAPWGRPPVPPGAETCGVRVSWDATRVVYPALLDPVWSSAASMNEARASFGSVSLGGGRVLAAGGASSPEGGAVASAELYDPATDTWSVTGSLNAARRAFTLTAHTLPDGSSGAIAVGGDGSEGALASTELYDPATGSWSLGPELSVAYAGHAAARLDDGALLVAGGSVSTSASLLAADGSSWQAAGELHADEPGSSLTALSVGGAILIGPNAPNAQRYSPLERSWRVAGEPALARASHTATRLLDGRVLLVGGNASQLVELYDPSSDGFSFTGATNTPHFAHTATLLADGRVVVVGGVASGGAGGTEIYDPTWGTWVPGSGTSETRFLHRAERVDDDRLLAFGGIDAATVSPGSGATEDVPLASVAELAAPRPATTISEYKLPARLDPDVTRSTLTELWASVTRPATLADGQRYPLLVFLHGNHATCGSGENPRQDDDCSYTQSGVCPEGYVVVPSHRGYDYVTTELAAHGFIVVSVNANRGINCGGGEDGDFGFNLARGRLLLQHLRYLADLNRGTRATPESIGVSLQGKLDFSELGMMGHSRGGEGVRAAYEQYRDPESPWPRRIGPVNFRALFEIGPVDGQSSRVLNADGTTWTVLLPMCDGDVSDLQGVKPFDRMLGLVSEQRESPKSTFTAWGTNHNFFNTEWQQSDSFGCTDHRPLFRDDFGVTGSAEQRQIGLRSLLTFFVANVGADHNPVLNELFDPTSALESGTRVDRGHTPSLRPNRGVTLEDFSGVTGVSARGAPMVIQSLSLSHEAVPEHDFRLRGARIDWLATASGEPPSPTDERYLELPVSTRPEGIDLSHYTHLEFRAGRGGADDLLAPSPLLVQLVNATGSLSEPLEASAFGMRLDGPVGGPYNTHVVLQTARLPLSAFAGATLPALRGVRFSFPDPRGASLYLASVRASLGTASLSPIQGDTGRGRPKTTPLLPGVPGVGDVANASQVIPGASPPARRQRNVEGNVVVGWRALEPRRVDIELSAGQAFQALDDQLMLQLGPVQSSQSRHPDGDLKRVVFTLEASDFLAVPDGERLLVRYATGNAIEWDFGALDKSVTTP
jgi:hypothetical protein